MGVCHNLTEGQVNAVFYTRIGAATFAFAACLVTLAVLCIFMCWLRVWTTFVHRLKLYLTAVALVLSVLYLLQVLPMKFASKDGDDDSWNEACKPIAFLLQYTDWVILLLICWLVIYLYRLSRCIGRPLTIYHMQRWHKCFEATAIIVTFTFPLLLVWIPFVTDSYGVDSQRWCEVITGSCRKVSITGIALIVGDWYLPAAIVALVCTTGIIIALANFWKFYNQQGLTHQMSQSIVKGIPPITYLVLYNTINCIDISSYIYHNLSGPSWERSVDYHLWETHAITGPGRAMIIPFAFVLSHFVTRCCSREAERRRESYSRLND